MFKLYTFTYFQYIYICIYTCKIYNLYYYYLLLLLDLGNAKVIIEALLLTETITPKIPYQIK